MNSTCFCLSLVALVVSAGAQNTWIVDRNNGPGTNFTDLPPAVQAAAPGDRIEIRAGGYAFPARIDKALTIVGAPWANFSPTVTFSQPNVMIENIPAGQTLVLMNLELGFPLPFTNPQGVQARNNAGTIHIEACEMGLFCARPYWSMRFEDCAQVTISKSYVNGTSSPMRFTRTNVHAVGSLLEGGAHFCDPDFPQAGTDAVYLEDSFLALLNSTVHGADVGCSGIGTRALVLNRSIVVAGRGSRILGGIQYCNPFPTCSSLSPIGGTSGVAYVDPTVDFSHTCGLPATLPGVSLYRGLVTSIHPGTLQLGGTLQLTLRTEPGSLAVAFADTLRAGPITSAFGPLWIDPGAALNLGVLAVGATGVATPTYLVPAGMPTGLVFQFQAIVLTPLAAIVASLPGAAATSQ